MNKIFLPLVLILSLFCTTVQAQEGEQNLHETGRTFMRSGDFDNAILVLTRALQAEPKNTEIRKDLVLSHYYKRDYAKAKEQLEPLLDGDDADIVTYQIAGNVYKALEEVKDAEKMYKKALKKFPTSGALHSEYGELLWAKKEGTAAIEQWEQGIKSDPSFAGNYYNAALYYFYTKDKVWALVYGEIFVNMESLTERASAMKQILFKAYKEKLFADIGSTKDDNKSDFAKAFLQTMSKQAGLVNRGITTQTLTMIRSRFILDWFNTYASKFPFRLFDYQRQLMREGMFEAYNQWLFGTVENLAAYDNWTKTHAEAYSNFTTFQKGRVFKVPGGQYYQDL